MLRHWLSKLLPRMTRRSRTRRAARPAAPRRYRAALEHLEDRLAPALAVTEMSALTPMDLAQTVLGGSAPVTNVRFNGQTGVGSSAGIFQGGQDALGIDSGVVLSTGRARDVLGPNKSNTTSTALNLPGDALLNSLLPPGSTPTLDATSLEFDFIPSSSQVQFKLVFASDEYNDIRPSFGDLFGMFVNGQNVAFVPGTSAPISVSTINGGNPRANPPIPASNAQYFRNNELPSAGLDVEMDGLTTVLTVTATVTPRQVNTIRFAVGDVGDAQVDTAVFIQAPSLAAAVGVQTFNRVVTGTDFGSAPHVVLMEGDDGTVLQSFFAYDPAFRGGVHVALGDVNNDGVVDIITGPGLSGGPHVKVFNGVDLSVIYSFMAYPISYLGGLNVAAGDFNNDGRDDIVVATDTGVAVVKVFDAATLNPLRDFLAYDLPFGGGARVAVGDVNNDGFLDLVTGAGPGGGPHVKAFSGRDNSVIQSFMAFNPAFSGGVYVAAGDFEGTGAAEILVGAGQGAGPYVRVFEGVTSFILQDFLADVAGAIYYPDGLPYRSGVRVAATDIHGDGRLDIVTAFGPFHEPIVKVFDYTTTALYNFYFPYSLAYLGGVQVGAV